MIGFCKFCGNKIELSEKEEECIFCGFINYLIKKKPKVKKLFFITKLAEQGFHICKSPFDEDLLNNLSKTQKTAILKVFNKTKLNKIESDFVKRISQKDTLNNLINKQSKYEKQIIIYSYFNENFEKRDEIKELPFDKELLNSLGSKQKTAIENLLEHNQLEMSQYLLIYRLSMKNELERIKKKKDKYSNQIKLSEYFIKYSKNIFLQFEFQNEIKILYSKLSKIINTIRGNKLSKQNKEQLKNLKQEYDQLIEKYPFILSINDENIKNLNLNKKDLNKNKWFFSFPLNYIVQKENKDLDSRLAINQHKFVEENLNYYLFDRLF